MSQREIKIEGICSRGQNNAIAEVSFDLKDDWGNPVPHGKMQKKAIVKCFQKTPKKK